MKTQSIYEFVENNIDAIEEGKWWYIYERILSDAAFPGAELTKLLHEIDVFPEHSECKYMPQCYYEHSNTVDKVTVFSSQQTRIEPLTYAGCVNLQKGVIPEGIEEIGCSAFLNCVRLCEVQFPSTLKCIEGDAFKGCSALKLITLPKNIKFIDETAFRNCSIKEITYTGTVKQWVRQVKISTPLFGDTDPTIKAYERSLDSCPNIIKCKDGQIKLRK